MKIQKNYLFIVVLLITIIIMNFGCTNIQSSSMEEAKYTVQQLPNFQKHIQYFSVSSGSAFTTPVTINDPFINKFDPKLPSVETSEVSFVHVIIYENKQGSKWLTLLDDSRPPKIIIRKELK